MNDIRIKNFIRTADELDRDELLAIQREGGYLNEIDCGEPLILEAIQITFPFPDNDSLCMTSYIFRMPGVIYLQYCFGSLLNDMLKQITQSGQICFFTEFKEKLPTFYKLLYNSMIYKKDASNSDRGVMYADNDQNLFFAKSFMIGTKQMDLEEIVEMCGPYTQVGLELIEEVLDHPVLDEYKKRIESQNNKQLVRLAASMLIRGFLGGI